MSDWSRLFPDLDPSFLSNPCDCQCQTPNSNIPPPSQTNTEYDQTLLLAQQIRDRIPPLRISPVSSSFQVPPRLNWTVRFGEVVDEDEEIQGIPQPMDEDDENQYMDMEEDDDEDLSYEELLALGEEIGPARVNNLPQDVILANLNIKSYCYAPEAEPDICVVCQDEYKVGEQIATLGCAHQYHATCIASWLMKKNVCPCCKRQVFNIV